jgi:hypothetical protein
MIHDAKARAEQAEAEAAQTSLDPPKCSFAAACLRSAGQRTLICRPPEFDKSPQPRQRERDLCFLIQDRPAEENVQKVFHGSRFAFC